MSTLRRFGGKLLQRIDLGYWYKMGEIIHPLTELRGERRYSDIFIMLHIAKNEIQPLLPQMFSSRANAVNLIRAIDGLLAETDTEAVFEAWRMYGLSQAASLFETAFKAELGTQPCYHVTPKGGYNVDMLTLAPENLFPADLPTLVPATVGDIVEVGKCLAFEVPTAAAFHLHRINEAVLHVYWDVFTKGTPRPVGGKNNEKASMGVYLSALKRRRKKDAKLIAVLQQIKNLHRNPAIHPETYLNVEDAIGLYGIIRSSVNEMLITIRASKAPANDSSSLPKLLSHA